MEENLENFLLKIFHKKEASHHITTFQKIKVFIDSKLLESAGKNQEARLKEYYETLTSVRELVTSEIISNTLNENIRNTISQYHQKKETLEKDVETFNDIASEKSKKNKPEKK